MYGNIYNEMVFRGIAIGIENPIWINREGEVSTEEE